MKRKAPRAPAQEGTRHDQPARSEAAAAICRRPGCGHPLPAPGRGRTRQFCSDDCARRYHNDARIPAPAAASRTGDTDPLAALDVLLRQAAVLVRAAREQAASLDPAAVRAQIAEAEAARRRAEAAAVTAAAQAAEARQETQALAEALAAARDDTAAAQAAAQEAADTARAAAAELAQLRSDTAAQITAITARAEEQAAAARADADRCARERDDAITAAAQARHAADTEISRARQAETDARDRDSPGSAPTPPANVTPSARAARPSSPRHTRSPRPNGPAPNAPKPSSRPSAPTAAPSPATSPAPPATTASSSPAPDPEAGPDQSRTTPPAPRPNHPAGAKSKEKVGPNEVDTASRSLLRRVGRIIEAGQPQPEGVDAQHPGSG